MSKYKMDDCTVVNTEKATACWNEDERWDGSNWISKATGSQWHHERLYRSSKGRYYIEQWSSYESVLDSAIWTEKREAATWLLANGHELPEELVKFVQEIEE